MMWPFVRLYKMRIVLKSGNEIILDRLIKFEFDHTPFDQTPSKITSLSWCNSDKKQTFLQWVDLSQIEAVVVQIKTYFSLKFW